jgi:hypothetical protein
MGSREPETALLGRAGGYAGVCECGWDSGDIVYFADARAAIKEHLALAHA